MKILVADDEPLFLELIAGYLRAVGYNDIHAVTSGPEALRAIAESTTPFDCFLLDVRMPGMDGIALCERIRDVPAHAVTPVVMITSVTDKDHVDRAFRAGANDYVTKPIDRREVEARMGMVEALVKARSNASQLMQQLGEAATVGAVAFEDAVELDEADGVMALSSMENYLLRLGRMRVFSCAAVGLHVENAGAIHARTEGQDFVDILGEVAVAIRDTLPDAGALLTYAGSGDFCAVMARTFAVEPSELALLINDTIAQRLNLLNGTDVPMPVVRVGAPRSGSLMPFDDPTGLIYRAIDTAHPAPTEKGQHLHAG